MDGTVVYVLVIVVVALTFDFINGFHDSANSIATVVSTRVLTPGVAVFWAAFFNFIAAFLVGTAVAKTIGAGLIDIDVVDPSVILGALIGAIVWDLITWWGGLPSSSSHALLGGYAGAAIAKAGFGALIPGGWTLPLLFIIDTGRYPDVRAVRHVHQVTRRQRKMSRQARALGADRIFGNLYQQGLAIADQGADIRQVMSS